jgi:propionyl-CoA synthetase
VLDFDDPPFSRWFVGGRTNLCHNAVDRHLAEGGDRRALAWVSTETGESRQYTYRELHAEVSSFAAVLEEMGVEKGDRVMVYLPMIPEAAFAMLACARLGAVHSVVFGGFAADNLATRVDATAPKVLVTADAGSRGGRVVPYKKMVEEALSAAERPPERVLVVNRGLDPEAPTNEVRDVDYTRLRERHEGAEVPVRWLESNEPSYVLYTSGTTGTPKGVQRDTGGYAVALAASMLHIFGTEPGETMFSASDVGWIVGHSYIVYGPLIHGTATVLYEGLPARPDPGAFWKIVEDYRVSTMFTAPTAIRTLKKEDPKYLGAHDTSSLRTLFLAGEPLDVPTYEWISEGLGGVRVVDNYWQTETGWPILCGLQPGAEDLPPKPGSAGLPVYGYDVRLVREDTGGGEVEEVGERGVIAIKPPLPPGCLSTLWGDDERFVRTYFENFPGKLLYSTFDWATRDEDGYHTVLGRSDDVINVSGHRLGTREVEEAISSHPSVAEVAVVGVADEIKGQAVLAYVVLRGVAGGNSADEEQVREVEQRVKEVVARRLGAVARPREVRFVDALPKTRSGKLVRRMVRALAEGRDPGDASSLEDPSALESVGAATAATSATGRGRA